MVILRMAPAWLLPTGICCMALAQDCKKSDLYPGQPAPNARAAILVDAGTGAVLFEREASKPMLIASCTKILTGILVIEAGNLTDIVTVSKHAASTPFSPLSLKEGEEVSVRDLLYALLLRSANDAAVALAEHVAGTEKDFVALMNAKAKELGCRKSHFDNPHGLDSKTHYSCAADLAILARYALQNAEFCEIIKTSRRKLSRSISKTNCVVYNHNKTLGKVDGADGVKSGFTKAAKNCFVGSCTRDGWRLISVVLGSPGYIEDTKSLLDFGFQRFKVVRALGRGAKVAKLASRSKGRPDVYAVAAADLHLVLPKGASPPKLETVASLSELRHAVRKGEKVGVVTLKAGSRQVAQVGLVASGPLEAPLGFAGMFSVNWPLVIGVFCLGSVLYVGKTAKIPRRSRRRLKKKVRRIHLGG